MAGFRGAPGLELAQLGMGHRIGTAFLQVLVFVVAAVLIIMGYHAAGMPDGSWAITSTALVLQTGAQASLRVAAIRIAANLVGAAIALLALRWDGSSIPSLAVALLLVGLVCQLTKLQDGIRSAYVCVIIIMGIDHFAGLSPPIDRVSAVVIGSVLGVGVSWLTERIVARVGVPDH